MHWLRVYLATPINRTHKVPFSRMDQKVSLQFRAIHKPLEKDHKQSTHVMLKTKSRIVNAQQVFIENYLSTAFIMTDELLLSMNIHMFP